MKNYIEFKKKAFDISTDRDILFDSAMGTAIQELNLKEKLLPEEYNLTEPEKIKKIHLNNLRKGANIISANTFGANIYKYTDKNYLKKIIEAGLKIAWDSICEYYIENNMDINNREHYIALDIGPIGKLMEPLGNLGFEDVFNNFKKILEFSNDKHDIILFETMVDLYELKSGVIVAKEYSDSKIFTSVTLDKNKRLLTGADIKTYINIIDSLGVDAIGVNCSFGPKFFLDIIKDIKRYTNNNIFVQPNAGLPEIIENKTVFNLSKEIFSKELLEIRKLGVRILGGCCGTTPEYIYKLKEDIKRVKFISKNNDLRKKYIIGASSYNRTLEFKNNVNIIGERINPTGKKKLKNALLNNDLDYIIDECLAQIESGASVLDINLGVPELDEAELMKRVIKEIQKKSNVPLQIDSVNPKVIEAGLKAYNGKAIVNSVSGEADSLNKILPLIKKYGAMVVALTLDSNGIPKTAKERIEISKKIILSAESHGIKKEDIIIDPLVLTVSTNQEEVLESLKALRIISKELDLLTTMGVSNISFGLPNRKLINEKFLSIALSNGLNLPIVDPGCKAITDSIDVHRLIYGLDKNAENYINNNSNKRSDNTSKKDKERSLRELILDGKKTKAIKLSEKLLSEFTPFEILDNEVIKALDDIGDLYEGGEVFLPELMEVSDIVQAIFKRLKKYMVAKNIDRKQNKILIATVKGDIHDIGKNIVKILLENYGFDVIDLGKDISKEDILNKTKEEDIKLVGLSALMTTTVESMKDTIVFLREKGFEGKIMVGGAVLTEDYAKSINADYYGENAKEAVNIANKFFNI